MEHKDIKYFEDYELKKHTTFKIGGCARKVWFPKTKKEFAYLLSTLDNPVVLGGCSNVLISSAGIDRDVILTTGLRNFSIDGFTITADCGVKAPMLSIQAQKNGLSGFEFMIGFPGTVGGIIRMNASAHSQAVSDTCINAKVFDMKTKSVLELSKNELEFKYRSSILGKKNYILLSAKFELTPDDKEKIQALMDRNKEFRRNKQPNLTLPNAGSTFKVLRIYDNISGGNLKIEGKRSKDKDFIGHASIRDFNLHNTPVLAKVLSVASLTGIVGMLSGEGIAFSHLDAPFEYKNKVLKVEEAKAFGNVLGITMNGSYNWNSEEIKGEGVIAPAYSINSFIGKIPLVGNLLAGKDGTVFAANYSVSGTINNTDVSINPLSALSPGSLKDWFSSVFGSNNGTN